MNELSKKIQAILFHEASPVKKTKIKKILNISEDELLNAINELKKGLDGHAISLVETDEELSLRVNSELSKFISEYDKNQAYTPLGPSSVEVLSIIIYLGKALKADIDYIRGVNSSVSIKSLMIKGYIEKKKDGSKIYYIPKTDALSYLGITDPSQMPDYSNIRNNLLELLGRAYEESR